MVNFVHVAEGTRLNGDVVLGGLFPVHEKEKNIIFTRLINIDSKVLRLGKCDIRATSYELPSYINTMTKSYL